MKTGVEDINPFKSKLKKSAEILVLEKFPKKILELEELNKNEKFRRDFDVSKDGITIPESLDMSGSSNGQSVSIDGHNWHLESTSTRVHVNGINAKNESVCDASSSSRLVVVASNRYLREMTALLRPQMWELIEDSLAVSVGINLMIPQIEDGNNFGVEIQQEVIDTIIGIENDANKRLREICLYFASRGDLIAKVVKYPHNEDYLRAVTERDQAFHKFICESLLFVRNNYLNLHNLIVKNLNKIKKPKSGSSNEMLY